MSRLGWGSLLIVAAAATGLLLSQWAGAQDAPSRRSSEPSVAGLEKKLEDVLAKQDDILKRFDAVMEELRIVKVRCTK